MNEAFLHYCWKYRLLKNELFTTDNQQVTILRSGDVNHDAGPDFFNAHLKIGDTEWAGTVEIHLRSSDWNLHKHSSDKRYNNVILHVVHEHDCEIELENGHTVTTLELKDQLLEGVWEKYQTLTHPALSFTIPCSGSIESIPQFTIGTYLQRLAAERLEEKSEAARRLLSESGNSWETCCYWLMARCFGGKVNALPFELLAKSVDMRILAKIKDSRFRIEALFFGQAGMLEENFSDEYPKQLKKEYEYLRKIYNLKPLDSYLWKFFRVRPQGFPTIRISQFSDFIFKSSSLFSKLLSTSETKKLLSFFEVSTSEYWETHYHFDKPVHKKKNGLSRDFASSILVNAWCPMLLLYGNTTGQESHKENSLRILESLECEDNKIIREWQKLGLAPQNALHSQALIQLYNGYCTKRRCLECQIGFKIIKG